MKIENYCIDYLKEFPLAKLFTLGKKFEYVLGVITDNEVSEESLNEIKEKSNEKVVFVGKGNIDNFYITFFEITDEIHSAEPLLNSIGKYIGSKERVQVNFVPHLKEMCIDCWGNRKYSLIKIENRKIPTSSL